jgi:O-antigen ligase
MFLIPFLIIKSWEDFRFWLKMFAWSFVLPVLFADLDLLRGGQFYPDAGVRVKGTFSHPNILAFYLALGLTFYFYFLKSRLVKLKPIVIRSMRLLMVNMIILLVATKTRNAWLACFGSFFIYGLLKDRKFLLMLILLIPLSFGLPQVRDRVVTLFNGQSSSVNYQGINSFEWRLRMWKSSFSKIARRPLQGYGLTSFMRMSEIFSEVGGKGMGAHNIYLETLFETGIVGLLSLLALFFTPLLIFSKYMRSCAEPLESKLWAVVVAYMVGYIIVGSADNLSYYLVFNWYVWFFIGLMMLSKKFMPLSSSPIIKG